MTLNLRDRKWYVYKHTSPSNKVYIGITSVEPRKRWANGLGYRTQTVMWRAIQKYGWSNFKHEILEYNLSYQEAVDKEIFYIEKYKSNCRKYYSPKMGYNMDAGGSTGHGQPLSEETKYKLSHSNYHEEKRRIIDCYDMMGNLINIYPDLASIQNDYPTIARTNIVKNCKGEVKSLQGLRFFYHEMTNGSLKIEPNYDIIERDLKNKIVNNLVEDCEIFDKYADLKNELGTIEIVSQYTLEGEYIKTFFTLFEAAKSVNSFPGKIKDACNKRRRTLCGYQWVYGSKEENGDFIEPEIEEGYIEYIKNGKIYKVKDLVGEKINSLMVLRKAENEDFQYCKSRKPLNLETVKEVHWLCKCDCGSFVTVSNRNLKSGHTKSCGCRRFKDLTGEVIGRLNIIEKSGFTEERENIWRCVCECGNETFKPTSYFSRGSEDFMCEECTKRLKSLRLSQTFSNKSRGKKSDLRGLKVGLLTVIDRAEDYVSPDGKRRVSKWLCECECGNTTEVSQSCLLNKITLSCGCLQRNLTGKVRVKEDLSGKTFGRWLVLYQGDDIIAKNGRRQASWVCQCSCEKKTIKTVSQIALKSRTSKSCGCLNSELASERMKNYNKSR